MGSDSSPSVLFEWVLQVAKSLSKEHTLTLLVQEGVFETQQSLPPQIQFFLSKEAVEMDDNPLLAVRRKKESSMALGLQLLKEGKVDALVSAGNTGALMAMAMVSLPLLPGIERPALLAELPTVRGSVSVLDVGANLSVKPSHLVQFARLGVAYKKVRSHLENPKVGLLNIGTESQKGTVELQKTYLELQKSGLAFIGNIEGPDVFRGNVDVLVTDGFTGNIFLKTAEGVSGFVLDYTEKLLTQHAKDEAGQVITSLHKYLNYAEYFGAILAGIDGLVVKVHGYSSPKAFINGILGAIRLSEEKLIPSIKSLLKL